MNDLIYKRSCPKCNKEIVTKNKYFFKKSSERNSSCLSCALVGKKKSERHRKNLSKNHADFSGEKNPFYGRVHSEETRVKCGAQNIGKDRFTEGQKEKKRHMMTGERNPFYGKKHTPETLFILSAPKSEECKIKLSLANKGKPSSRKGLKISDESKRKMRISAINRLKRTLGEDVFKPNINPSETLYFSELEKKMGWNGIYYGKNGKKSQYFVDYLGYYVDFYDETNNIVVEYDETGHYDANWNLVERDIHRQNEIKSYLNCKFFRYNAALNRFYEV